MIKSEISVKRENNKTKIKHSVIEKYNWNKEFTRGIQMQIWTGKRMNHSKCEGKTMEIIKSKE